jgi:ABC-2 type transport system ATP-binding protein
VIDLSHIRKRFGQLTAVDDLSLEIHTGEVFGLLGPNGAGKSTTISMITGVLAPDEGRVLVDGANPVEPATRRVIGVAPQSLALYDELSARENLLFFGSLYNLDRKARTTQAAALLDMVGLTDRAHHRVKGFSGGMKRRLNLACALMHKPKVVLLDEPTAGVEPQSRNAIFEIVSQLGQQGTTVLYTTHYMEEAQKLCSRVAIVDHGKLLALDTVDGLIAAHGGESVVRIVRAAAAMETTQTDQPLGVIEQALMRGDVESVEVRKPDLETVFLNLTGRRLRD